MSNSFFRGFSAATLLAIGGHGAHWFLTPALHPDASGAWTAAVALQCAIGLGGGVLMILRERINQRDATAAS